MASITCSLSADAPTLFRQEQQNNDHNYKIMAHLLGGPQ